MSPARRPGTPGPRWSVWARTVVRLLLAAVFVVAGANKVLDLRISIDSVEAYQLLPAPLAHVVGVGLPFAEIVLGLVLAAGLVTRAAAAVAAVVLAGFTAAVVSVAARGIDIDCGCFGGGGPVAPGQTGYGLEIVRDLLLLAAAVWLVVRPATRLSLAGGLHRPDDPAEPAPEEPVTTSGSASADDLGELDRLDALDRLDGSGDPDGAWAQPRRRT
ncbi:putative membrane protein YphA (DoxX/SURF4 family) [Friedmanniella endophytica]|uniref:Putative membrane protein YphA (DoxX/SURF4 family) n=1 Tax=Microlunatus kandeliicorticis TaxID=1759536 RepID=A0A7W3P6P6_9ACTN|nr:DoxX family protein [Microlunatus kandeliicorticis]MBA8795194.1 putative membrane protein YphA (DoxX/SURF4 family) [Microlunatus kandeliicorticis]